MSTKKAGGLGINLFGANRVVIFDASWNPSDDIQSISRVFGFGQTKPCYIYRFVAQGTMEEKIYNEVERHFKFEDINEMYRFNPDEKVDRPTPPLVPKDRLLADLLVSHEGWIDSYFEHDTLLVNKVDEELTESERKQAWEEYEAIDVEDAPSAEVASSPLPKATGEEPPSSSNEGGPWRLDLDDGLEDFDLQYLLVTPSSTPPPPPPIRNTFSAPPPTRYPVHILPSSFPFIYGFVPQMLSFPPPSMDGKNFSPRVPMTSGHAPPSGFPSSSSFGSSLTSLRPSNFPPPLRAPENISSVTSSMPEIQDDQGSSNARALEGGCHSPSANDSDRVQRLNVDKDALRKDNRGRNNHGRDFRGRSSHGRRTFDRRRGGRSRSRSVDRNRSRWVKSN
jgi:hypothetical protein